MENKIKKETNERKLDQFYTKPEVSKLLYNNAKELIVDFDDYVLIEPSAGNGSFSNLFTQEFIAIDIDPKCNYIKQENFLTSEIINNFLIGEKKYITIGNPPFGKNSSLAIKFFNKSAKFSDYICFILPKTFKKDSIVNKLDLYLHKIYEIELSKDSFTFCGLNYDVPCVFQIWEKRKTMRKQLNKKLTTEYFEFSNENNADFAIRRVGGLAGKLILDFKNYKPASHYYIKVNVNKININRLIDIFINNFNQLNNISKNTSGNPSLSKTELITIIEKEI